MCKPGLRGSVKLPRGRESGRGGGGGKDQEKLKNTNEMYDPGNFENKNGSTTILMYFCCFI